MSPPIVSAKPLKEGEDACGIYFLLLNERVIYVGQSASIARRARAHRKTLSFDEIHFIEVEKHKLNEAERKFILELKPEKNGTIRNGRRDYCEPKGKPETEKQLTGNQLQKLLDSAGLSQRGAAKLIGISERQMRRYVSGDAKVPRVVEFAVRWVLAQRG